MTIPLGVVVKDKVSGFTGVVENRATFMYGCDRYCIQPKCGEDGKLPDSQMIDEPQLDILEGTRVMSPISEPEKLVEMGCVVTDPIKGLEGTVTGRAVYLNGCSRVFVESKQIRDKQTAWWVDEKQVVAKKTITGKPVVTKEPEVKARTGGPAPSSSKY